MKKKLLSILLSAFMIMTSFTTRAFADDLSVIINATNKSGDSGTDTDGTNFDIKFDQSDSNGWNICDVDNTFSITSKGNEKIKKIEFTVGAFFGESDISTENLIASPFGTYNTITDIKTNDIVTLSFDNSVSSVQINWKDENSILQFKSAKIYYEDYFTVSYDANNATSGTVPTNQTKTSGVGLNLATNTGNLAKTDYTFNGWNTKADGSGTHYDAGAIYATDADTTLYAEWINYALAVNKQDGTLIDYYDKIDKAIEKACEVSGTVVLLKDYENVTSSIVIPENANIVFDLNGKKISGSVNSSGIIKLTGSNAKLTIKNGTVENLHSKGKYGIYVLTGDNMELILENVIATGTSSGVYLNKNTCVATLTDCTSTFTANASKEVTINSGTYSSFGAGSTTTTNILGGTFGAIKAHAGTINIENGTFESGFEGQTSSSAPTVNISGGNFLGKINGKNTSKYNFQLSGGYYEIEPDDTLIVKTPKSYTTERTGSEDEAKVDIEKYKYKVVEGTSYVAQILDAGGSQIADKKYTNLADAFTNAENGQTIQLIKNIDIKDSKIEINNKTITLDQNGKTIYGSNNDGVLVLTGTTKLTVKGSGLIECSGKYSVYVKDTAELALDHGTIRNTAKDSTGYGTGAAVGLFENSKFNATNCNIISELEGIYAEGSSIVTLGTGASAAGGNYLDTYGAYLKDNAKLTINGGTLGYVELSGGTKSSGNGAFLVSNASITVNDGSTVVGERYGIVDNGEYSPGATITINGGTIKSTASSTTSNFAGIYHPGGGTLTIKGGIIEGNTGVYAKSGTNNISGGNIIAHGTKQNFYHSSSGMVSTGDALVVESCDYPSGAPKVSVTGGAFYSKNAYAVASYNQSSYEPIVGFLKAGIYGAGSDRIDIMDVASTKDLIAKGYTDIRNPDTATNIEHPWMIGVIDIEDPEEDEILVDTGIGIIKVDTSFGTKMIADESYPNIEISNLNKAISNEEKEETIKNAAQDAALNSDSDEPKVEVNVILNVEVAKANKKTSLAEKIKDDKEGTYDENKVEYIDITIDKIVKENGEIIQVEEIKTTSDFQIISIPILSIFESNDVKERIFVYRNHIDEHNDETNVPFTKVEKDYGPSYNGECYWIDGDNICIKAKKFSVYGFGVQIDEIPAEKKPTPTPTPTPDSKPRYKVPKTGVDGTHSNNHSLLKLSSLSLLVIGTYLVIKKKKDN